MNLARKSFFSKIKSDQVMLETNKKTTCWANKIGSCETVTLACLTIHLLGCPGKGKWQFTSRCYLYDDVTITSCGGLSLECVQLVEWQVHVRRHGLIIFNGIILLPLSLRHSEIPPWVSASDCGSCLHHSSFSSWFIGNSSLSRVLLHL
jgi:hypothetical protein